MTAEEPPNRQIEFFRRRFNEYGNQPRVGSSAKGLQDANTSSSRVLGIACCMKGQAALKHTTPPSLEA